MSQSVEQFLLCMRMDTQLCWLSLLPNLELPGDDSYGHPEHDGLVPNIIFLFMLEYIFSFIYIIYI